MIGKKYEPVPYVAPAPRSPSPGAKDKESPTKSKKGGKGHAPTTPEPATQVGLLLQ